MSSNLLSAPETARFCFFQSGFAPFTLTKQAVPSNSIENVLMGSLNPARYLPSLGGK